MRAKPAGVGLRAALRNAAAALDSILDVEQEPVADRLALLDEQRPR